jgi:hypothetical protein
MADEEGDFRFAGAYLELNIRDHTEAQEKAIRDRISGGKPVEIPTTLGAPTNDPLKDRAIPPVQIPTTASDPIDDAWRARVQASLRDTTKTALDIPLGSDTAAYRDDLKLKLAAIQGELKQSIPTDIADADAYKLKVEALAREVSDSLAVKLKVKLDPESEARIAAEIQALEDLANRSSSSGGGESGGPPSSGGASGAASAASGGGGAGFGALIGIGAALGSGAVAGASLLAIPAIFTAIGVAAEHSSPQVVQSVNDMTAAAKKAVTEGFTPFAPALSSLAGEAKSAVTGLEGDFYQASVAGAPLLQLVGHDFIAATQAGIGQSVPILAGMRPVAQALGDDLLKMEQGIGGFFQNLDVGQAAAGLSAVGTVVKDDLPAVGSLLSDIAPLGTALLNILAPALSTTVSELSFVKPVAEGVGAALGFLSPAISAVAGPALGMEVATKLLTGSWTDWGGAVSKVKSVLQDANGEFDKGQSTLNSLAKVIGITTASAKASAIQSAEDTATKAALTAQVDKLALTEAEEAVAADASAKNKLALIAAQEAEAESAAAATAAQEALTAAEEASTFSFGPLGIVLGVVGGALALVGLNSHNTAKSIGDLSSAATQLSNAAPDAISGLVGGNDQVAYLVNQLSKAGVSLSDYQQAAKGSTTAQAALNAELKDTQAKVVAAISASGASVDVMQNFGDAVNGNKDAYNSLSPALRKAVDETTAMKDVQTALGDATASNTQKTNAQKAAAAQAAQQTALSSEQQQEASGIAKALGLSIDDVTNAFRAYAGGVTFGMSASEKLSDQFLTQTLAVDTANATVGNYFKTADAAVASASQSLADAQHSAAQGAEAVSSAQHSLAQSAQAVVAARQAVATAERGVTDALANEVIAQNNVSKAEAADEQAVRNLTVARQQAIETLKALHLQMADQVTSETSARLALFDQTTTSATMGVTAANAQAIVGEAITSANEAQIKSANDLLKAQQTLADTLNTGSNLRDQVTAADKAGVDGAPGVISAQQAIANAQDQVTSADQALVKAHQAVSDAQANVLKAEQGVTDALYNEGQARKAVADAMYNEGKQAQAVAAARVALQTAQDNDSHSMDINTAAGQRNLAMMQQIAQQLFQNENPQQAGNDLIKQTATLFGISTTAAQAYLTNLGKIPANFQFGLTAVAAADFSELNNAYHTILARGANATAGLPVPHATGGPIEGVGGPTEDNILIRASAREFMQPVSSVDYYGTPFMEAIRQKRIPKDAIQGLAMGGTVGDLSNALGLGGLGDLYQVASDTLGVLGVPSPPAPASLPLYVAPTAPVSAGAGGLGAGVTGSRAANEALMQQIFASQFGWTGPEWAATQYLMMRESGFNNTAQNPTSTAYGQFQFLNSTWAGYGIPKTSDSGQQDIAGGRYIQARYGDPIGAAAHEQRYNWFDDGGYFMPGKTLVDNATTRPEMALPPGLTNTLESINAVVQGGTIPVPAQRTGRSVAIHNHITQQPREDGSVLAARVSAETSWALMTSVGG